MVYCLMVANILSLIKQSKWSCRIAVSSLMKKKVWKAQKQKRKAWNRREGGYILTGVWACTLVTWTNPLHTQYEENLAILQGEPKFVLTIRTIALFFQGIDIQVKEPTCMLKSQCLIAKQFSVDHLSVRWWLAEMSEGGEDGQRCRSSPICKVTNEKTLSVSFHVGIHADSKTDGQAALFV